MRHADEYLKYTTTTNETIRYTVGGGVGAVLLSYFCYHQVTLWTSVDPSSIRPK